MTKYSGKGTPTRHNAALKAVATKRENRERAAKGLPPLPGTKGPSARAMARIEKQRALSAPAKPGRTPKFTQSAASAATPATVRAVPAKQPAKINVTKVSSKQTAAKKQTAAEIGATLAGMTQTPAIKAASAAPVPTNFVMTVPKTWENDGKELKVWLDDPKKAVTIPIEAKRGPYTPSDLVPDVLGQPGLLFSVAVSIHEQLHSLLEGPTGVAKTTVYRWFAQQLNWNLVAMPISRGTEAAHLVGEYYPDEADSGEARFSWAYGPVSTAVLASQTHPTLLVFEELNRIGNLAELARIYSLLDSTRLLEVKEKRDSNGNVEVLHPGKLIVGANMNPADDDAADYLGVNELDPALRSRFALQPTIPYPPEKVEAQALCDRVSGLNAVEAIAMVRVANDVRKAAEVRFPFSFRELQAWAQVLPYYGWEKAAEVAVVTKAHPDYRAGILDSIRLGKPGPKTT